MAPEVLGMLLARRRHRKIMKQVFGLGLRRVLQRGASVASKKQQPFAIQSSLIKSFSSDSGSHDDFSAKLKTPAGSPSTNEALGLIKQHVNQFPILLYMKGTPQAPQCGFSQQVVRILHAQGVDFDSVNVLEHPHIREGVKEYSQWPTIPQLYVKGEFVGGCDILTDMHQSGELSTLLKDLVPSE